MKYYKLHEKFWQGLLKKGFISWDKESGIISIKEKVSHYVKANAKKKDSDNIKLVSKTKKQNGVLNLKTNEILGCLFHLESKNFMHSFSKDIYYEKNSGLRIDAWEKTLFQDTIYYSTNLILEKN